MLVGIIYCFKNENVMLMLFLTNVSEQVKGE